MKQMLKGIIILSALLLSVGSHPGQQTLIPKKEGLVQVQCPVKWHGKIGGVSNGKRKQKG